MLYLTNGDPDGALRAVLAPAMADCRGCELWHDRIGPEHHLLHRWGKQQDGRRFAALDTDDVAAWLRAGHGEG